MGCLFPELVEAAANIFLGGMNGALVGGVGVAGALAVEGVAAGALEEGAGALVEVAAAVGGLDDWLGPGVALAEAEPVVDCNQK